MRGLPMLAGRMTIRSRVALALGLAIAVAGLGLVAWTTHVHRQGAIAQARDFARSVHQLTLAGLTAMMMTGGAPQRRLFLDQIERANDVRSLRVLRSPSVQAAYGAGTVAERPSDPLEERVIATGQPVFEVREDSGREFLRAVMPAVASRDSLGKDCLGCHGVAEGTVLGAVSLEISLDRVNASIAQFRRDVLLAGVPFLALLCALAWLAVRRTVSAPLGALTRELDSLAEGRVDLSQRLEVRGADEIAAATAAVDRVLQKAHRMLGDERIAGDVFEHALEGILVTDGRGAIVRVNPAFTRTTGYSADEAIGRNPRMLQSGQHDEAFYREFWDCLATRGEWQGDIWNRRKNGEIYPEWLNISRVLDDHGEVQNYVAVFSDITERKRQEALITFQAHHDALTGLPNRLLFRDRLQQALAVARRRNGRVAVMFLDLDRFKFINDSLGHDAGDELLRQVTRRLAAAVREADTVARLGGDEFTVLLPETDGPRGASAVAAKILELTHHPYTLAGQEVFVTTSIGISLFPEHGLDADTLMKRADAAMYEIKEQGRAGYKVYDDGLGARLDRHVHMETELRHALDAGELEMNYQPQLTLGGGTIDGVEALLRWRHPARGFVPSREFESLAEETGLIVPAGEWALRTACADAARWAAKGRALRVTLRLSGVQFLHHRLEAMVRGALASSGLRPALLELEISEGQAMQDVERTIAVLNRLSALGVKLAIAEFGMGFHSASHDLQRMPISAVKIDRALVRDLASHPESFQTVAAMARVRRARQLRVVAVGVESGEQLEILGTLRCDVAQGRYVGAAVDASHMDRTIIQAVAD